MAILTNNILLPAFEGTINQMITDFKDIFSSSAAQHPFGKGSPVLVAHKLFVITKIGKNLAL